MQIETIIRARLGDFMNSIEDEVQIFMVKRIDGKIVGYAEPVEMAEKKDVRCIPAAIKLDCHQGQRLIDDLWECGLRPSEGTGPAGAFAAIKEHLADMRTIAFKKRSIDK